jgi:glycosyltransferase involved in cell wall biosynthesis
MQSGRSTTVLRYYPYCTAPEMPGMEINVKEQQSAMQPDVVKRWTVTVLMVTYNHERFIRQAVESVVNQQTSFDFQLFIGEDCSKDRTREILLELKDQYPDKITLVLNKSNMGVAKNALQIHRLCFDHSEKYIAYLDGDDYWTDTCKLQKQFDVMERKPDISLCYHRCKRTYESGLTQITNEGDRERRVTISEIIEGSWFIMTCSMFLRKDMFGFPDWYEDFTMIGDSAIQVICAHNGDTYFLEDEMGVYRRHQAAISNTLLTMERASNYYNRMLDRFDQVTGRRYTVQIARKKRTKRDRLVEEFAHAILDKSPFQAAYWSDYNKILKYSSLRNQTHLKYLLRYLLISPFTKTLTSQ